MKERILFLTKDAMCKEYLPIYGNDYWKGKTPNLDELASKGTVFSHFYTAAPSTVMAFRSVLTGKFAHEQPYSDYIPMEVPDEADNFFILAQSRGYETHMIWDEKWERMVLRYGNSFGKNTIIHNVPGLNQEVGVHCKRTGSLVRDDSKVDEAISNLVGVVDTICKEGKKILVWIHLPHVIMGRIGYGDDIDIFDRIIGELRKYFSDDCIYISADHGNMNGYHGKFSYGFDVYTPAIEIPFIAPRINGMRTCETYVSNTDVKELILNEKVVQREFIYSDCAYYAQPHRKLAIISDGFAYIYNKATKKEELYDLTNDYFERCNLMNDTFYDSDRILRTHGQDVYFNPNWKKIAEVRTKFRAEKNRIWKKAGFMVELRGITLSHLKKIYVILRKNFFGH